MTKYFKCENCGNDTFKLRREPSVYDEPSYIEFKCTKCKRTIYGEENI